MKSLDISVPPGIHVAGSYNGQHVYSAMHKCHRYKYNPAGVHAFITGIHSNSANALRIHTGMQIQKRQNSMVEIRAGVNMMRRYLPTLCLCLRRW